MTSLILWDSDSFGQSGHNVHIASWAPDDHTDEPNVEPLRGAS